MGKGGRKKKKSVKTGKAKGGGRRESADGSGGGAASKRRELVETDLVSDVAAPTCNCNRTVSKSKYKPHLCPIEAIAQRETFVGLKGRRAPAVPKPSLVREQVMRRVSSAAMLDRGGPAQALVEDSKAREAAEDQGTTTEGRTESSSSRRRSSVSRLSHCKSSLVAHPLLGGGRLRVTAEEATAMLHKYQALLLRYKDPTNDACLAPVFSRCAALQLALGDYAGAAESAACSGRLDPYHAAAWFQVSQAEFQRCDYQRAAQALLQGLSHNPGNYRLEAALARVTVMQSETVTTS